MALAIFLQIQSKIYSFNIMKRTRGLFVNFATLLIMINLPSCAAYEASIIEEKIYKIDSLVSYSYIQSELYDYLIKHGRFPDSLEDLIENYTDTAMIEHLTKILLDPFSAAPQSFYIYIVTEDKESCALISRGIDGQSVFEDKRKHMWFWTNDQISGTDSLIRRFNKNKDLRKKEFDLLLFMLSKQNCYLANSYYYHEPLDYFDNAINDSIYYHRTKSIIIQLDSTMNWVLNKVDKELWIYHHNHSILFRLENVDNYDLTRNACLVGTYISQLDNIVLYERSYLLECSSGLELREDAWRKRKSNTFEVLE